MKKLIEFLSKIHIKIISFLFFLALLIISIFAFDCEYFSFDLPGKQTVKVTDSGVYIEGDGGSISVNDSGVKISQNSNSSNWTMVDNRNRMNKEGDYYVLYQHKTYKVNLKVTFYGLGNIFYNSYQKFIDSVKSKEENVSVSKSSIPNDYNRIVYKILVLRDNGTKSVFYTVSSDYGFYLIEFSGNTDYVSKLSSDLNYVINTFVPKY